MYDEQVLTKALELGFLVVDHDLADDSCPPRKKYNAVTEFINILEEFCDIYEQEPDGADGVSKEFLQQVRCRCAEYKAKRDELKEILLKDPELMFVDANLDDMVFKKIGE